MNTLSRKTLLGAVALATAMITPLALAQSAPATTPGTAVPTPMPMPGTTVKPSESANNGSGVVTTGGGTVVSGMPMTGMTTVMPMEVSTTTRSRMGLLSRLRMRR